MLMSKICLASFFRNFALANDSRETIADDVGWRFTWNALTRAHMSGKHRQLEHTDVKSKI